MCAMNSFTTTVSVITATLLVGTAVGCNKEPPKPAAEATPTVPAAEKPAAPTGAVPAAPAGAPGAAAAPAAGPGAMPPGHPPVEAAADVAIGDFAAADMTVADLNAKAKELNGKVVAVRGVVVKINRGILERNWLHVQDKTGKVVITTTGEAGKGALVVVKGTVAVDQDIGAGYKYDVLLKDSQLTVEREAAGAAPAAAPAPGAAPAPTPAPAPAPTPAPAPAPAAPQLPPGHP